MIEEELKDLIDAYLEEHGYDCTYEVMIELLDFFRTKYKKNGDNMTKNRELIDRNYGQTSNFNEKTVFDLMNMAREDTLNTQDEIQKKNVKKEEKLEPQHHHELMMIEWRDVSSVDMGMFTSDEIDTEVLPRCFIIGFLVKETKDAYYIAKESWDTGEYKYLHIIPKDTAILNVVKFTGVIDDGKMIVK